VIGDEFLEFIPMSLFEIEDRGSGVDVANGRWSEPSTGGVRQSRVLDK